MPFLKRKADCFIPYDIVQYYKRSFSVNGAYLYKPCGSCRGWDRAGEKGPVQRVGGVVVNCNPFTLGHRYLIEEAYRMTDFLYIFVVEEDLSDFSFQDRFQMVCLGTNDLRNVKVLPSGEYLGSKETFPQYFKKDAVDEIRDTDYDAYIFADVIAKELGISVRFVGEEPFDKVTAAYNRTLKRILPAAGVEVVEIPRKEDVNGDIISASSVRKCIKDKDRERLHTLLPVSTIQYLEKICLL